MSGLPWIRLYTRAVDNEKLRLLAFEDRWHFIALLCLKGQGTLDKHPQTLDRRIAVKLEVDLKHLGDIKKRLIDAELIDEYWQPAEWEKYHPSSAQNNRPSSEVWAKIRAEVFERDNYTCQYCGDHGVRLECDHIVPICRGGTNNLINLATACFSCNRSKHAKTLEEWHQ